MGANKDVNKIMSDTQGQCTHRYRVAVLEFVCEDDEPGELAVGPPSMMVGVATLVDMADDDKGTKLDDDDDDRERWFVSLVIGTYYVMM